MLLSLHGSRVSACAGAARPHAADGVVIRGHVRALLPPSLVTQAPRFFPKTAAPRCRPDAASLYARLTRSKFYNLIVIFHYVISLKIFLGKK